LEALPGPSRVAFGLYCCERMLPNYLAFMQRELARQNTDLILLATNPDIGILKSQWRAPAMSNIHL
jgi:hypothetical protein